MRRVLGREELERFAAGARVSVPTGTIVTPLAQDYAEAHGVELVLDPAATTVSERNGGAEAAPRDEPPGTPDDAEASDDELLEAVAGEVIRSLLQSDGAASGGAAVGAEALAEATDRGQCEDCANARSGPAAGHRGVISATGMNQPGIVARLAAEIAACGVDIQDISQTIVGGFFTMILVVDASGLAAANLTFQDFRDRISAAAVDLGCEVVTMHEKVLQSMQRI